MTKYQLLVLRGLTIIISILWDTHKPVHMANDVVVFCNAVAKEAGIIFNVGGDEK
jgi:hypothetical protein